MSSVVVDTDVASAILKGQLPESLRRRLAGQQLAITFVTVGELAQWTYLHRWGAGRRAGLRAFFASVVVLPCSFQPATIWGEIQAHARLRGRPRPINDSWIAACCIASELSLATLNIKDSPTSSNTRASNSSTEDTPRGMPRGTNHSTREASRDTGREQKAR